MTLGNLDAQRDWGFAPDYVDAMHRALQVAKPDQYVIATGTTRSVRDLAEAVFSAAGLNWRDHVRADPALLRPSDAPVLSADPSKARKELGWSPSLTFEQMIGLLVDADISRLRQAIAV